LVQNISMKYTLLTVCLLLNLLWSTKLHLYFYLHNKVHLLSIPQGTTQNHKQ
jgi:hypothetical protein